MRVRRRFSRRHNRELSLLSDDTAWSLMSSVQSIPIESQTGTLPRLKTISVACLALAILFLAFSPNYQTSTVDRTTPLGSDFLQEWTGGYIWSSSHRSQLYQSAHFTAVQHDPSIVGFSWPENQYYPMVYPPFYYMAFSPLAFLPYWVAVVIWLSLLAALTGATIWLWTSYYPPARNHWGKCLLAVLAFFPLLMSINTGHKSIILLLILSSTYLLLFHRKPLTSGMVFGLIAFKPHLGILIGVTMLLKRQWRFVAGSLLTVSILVGLSFFAGMDLCRDYFLQCLSLGSYESNLGYQLTESHNLAGALSLTFGTETTATRCAEAVLFGSIIVGLAYSMRGKLEATSSQFAVQFSILVLATVLLSPHFYIYDLVVLLLPMSLIAFNFHAASRMGTKTNKLLRHTKVLCAVFFALAGVSSSVAEQFHFQLTLPILLAILFCLAFQIDMNSIAQEKRKLAL